MYFKSLWFGECGSGGAVPGGWWLCRTWSASWRDSSVVLLEILSNVSFAMRSSFKKCGFRRLVGPVHEGI